MNKLSEILNIQNHKYLDVYQNLEVQNVRFFSRDNLLELYLLSPSVLPFDVYSEIKSYFEKDGIKTDLVITTLHSDIDLKDIGRYINDFSGLRQEYGFYKIAMPTVDKEGLHLNFSDKLLCDKGNQFVNKLKDYLKDIGLQDVNVDCIYKEINSEVDNIIVKKVETPKPVEAPKPAYRKPKMENYTDIELKSVVGPMEFIKFTGTIFQLEEITSKKGSIIQTFSIHDAEDAIVCKRFEGRFTTVEMLHEYKIGDYVTIYGSIVYDNFSRDLVVQPSVVEKCDKPVIIDDAKVQRVELHTHTNMSEMDGVTDIKDLIKFVGKLGHRAVGICDHAGVQSFAKAHNLAKDVSKGREEKFKVLYGCEMNMVDSELTIVRNGTDEPIDDATYISFDLETTGLSCYFDEIIEFGAVKIKNNAVVGRKQLFIKPNNPIPPFIQEKTNITNDMVKNAKPFEEVIDEILDFIGDDVLVAHNASFDYGFLNESLRRIGRNKLTNVVIDTLDMARGIHEDRRAYRLGNIARLYRITYDEEVAHRADYDAEVLADVFLCMIKDCKNKGAITLNDLQELQGEYAYRKMRKSHVVVMAKNQEGIKELYSLVTISNTKTLAPSLNEPRIYRKDIEARRENLLLGSACYNGEVFECAANKNDEELAKAIAFYDYIELQPIGNYAPLLTMKSIHSEERLRDIQRRIIKEAKRQNKIIVATGDVHYLTSEQKKFRDIYIATQGVGGIRHPLYIYNDELRKKAVNPDQHFLTTQEMLDAFAWLNDPQFVYDIVVTNTNKIANSIEYIQPVPSGTFPPIIEGSNDKLTNVCYETAHKVYGEELPEIVAERLDRELKSIIGHGYGVVYYISHLLVKKSNQDGYLVGSRGSVGSSFVATMSGITEVNPLKPHYVCPHCKHSEWPDDPGVADGFDMPDKVCPVCGTVMKGNGHNIPFETFLGFNGDKVPDIDLNFSNEYQAKAHAFTKEVFGVDHAFRAGTIGTVANKTALGYVTGYAEEMGITNMRKVTKEFLASGCEGVKRTTGQHPGGIIIVPSNHDASDFTPVQFPANDENSEWLTTHFDFHDIHDNVLKFDILGHVDPTAMKLLENISGIDVKTIPMNDPETLSLFSSQDALKIDTRIYNDSTGALGLPEFGTKITRRVLDETRPRTFAELVIISGLTHGTDVWAGNAQVLVQSGIPLNEVIGCRDDIMTYLIGKKLEPVLAFTIMESVRKGKGLKDEWIPIMKEHNVPDWYIDSCKKIKYMFPKAHAVAYVIMAVRVSWFKVHLPHYFYVSFFSLRCDAYEIETMSKGVDAIRARINDINSRMNDRDNPVTNKEKSLLDVFEVCLELYARGYRISNVDLYHSKATTFTVLPEDTKTLIPSFITIDGLGANVGKSIEEAREMGEFLSKEDLLQRTQLSSTMIKKLEAMGCLDGMQEENQMSLF